MAAFADLYYAQCRGCETRAVFAYDERLRLLPDYLQQLEMESNGKSVMRDGSPVTGPTAPITWGGVGTDAQHAVFQLLHQGTVLTPIDFLAAIQAGDDLDPAHHRILLSNCFAQGAALMAGGKFEQAKNVLDDFLAHILPDFGTWQDAMARGEPWMWHGLISASLNIGLLDPLETCRRAEAVYRAAMTTSWAISNLPCCGFPCPSNQSHAAGRTRSQCIAWARSQAARRYRWSYGAA